MRTRSSGVFPMLVSVCISACMDIPYVAPTPDASAIADVFNDSPIDDAGELDASTDSRMPSAPPRYFARVRRLWRRTVSRSNPALCQRRPMP